MTKIIKFKTMLTYIWTMDEDNMVRENTSLFLDLEQAIPVLEALILRYEHSDVLMVVLCEDAMPVANRIARELRLNLSFSAVGVKAETEDSLREMNQVDFDYRIVKESGRDIPQDFIIHQEQNLRTNLRTFYSETYVKVAEMYPGKVIILVDQLTNIDAAFFQCLTQRSTSEAECVSGSAIRRFVFLHIPGRRSANASTEGLDMVIEHSLIEVEQSTSNLPD